MDPSVVVAALPLLGAAGMLALRSLRQINQWEVGLKFTLGKYTGRMEPGLNMVFPVFQKILRIDTRIRNRDLPSQAVITRDNVTASIDAVVYYKVVDPEKAALSVENFELAVKDRAKVVLRDTVGEITLDELLGHRDAVAAKVRAAVEQFVSKWGVHVELIAMQDIQLPPNMQEAIAKKAIAERDKQAVIIKSQADLESAQNFAEAAKILTSSPGAMELRRLEALQHISNSGNSKIVFDLAKPTASNDSRQEALAAAAAMSDEGMRVRVPRLAAAGQRVPLAQPPAHSAEISDEEAAVVAEAEAGAGRVAR
jgi:regulator of protease activity HflC (stomatin/prohibitin superfamily)